MSTTAKRIDTINLIVAGSSISSEHECNLVIGEFNEVKRCTSVSPDKRKHLLQVLHSTRALDSALSAFLRVHALTAQGSSLGAYLYTLTRHSKGGLQKLTETERSNYQSQIVDKRNTYMHQAGSYPNQGKVVSNLLSEMQTCLTRVFSL